MSLLTLPGCKGCQRDIVSEGFTNATNPTEGVLDDPVARVADTLTPLSFVGGISLLSGLVLGWFGMGKRALTSIMLGIGLIMVNGIALTAFGQLWFRIAVAITTLIVIIAVTLDVKDLIKWKRSTKGSTKQ